MFNNSKYTRWYYELVESRKYLDRKTYVEKHHIIPKSLGGADAAENLVKLTAREHFIAHRLLAKMCTEPKHKKAMAYALWNMVNRDGGKRTSSYAYEELRKKHSNFLSEALIGENNPRYGYVMTEQEKLAMSLKLKGTKKSEEFRKNQSLRVTGSGNPMYGVPRTAELKESARKRMTENNPMHNPDVVKHITSLKKNTINCFDVETKKFVRVSTEEFNEYKNIKYIGNTTKRVKELLNETN